MQNAYQYLQIEQKNYLRQFGFVAIDVVSWKNNIGRLLFKFEKFTIVYDNRAPSIPNIRFAIGNNPDTGRPLIALDNQARQKLASIVCKYMSFHYR